MKYDFKVDQVILDIEHSSRRFIEEKCPGSTPIVDITSDPRSIVAANFLLNRIFPNRACAIYLEDRVRDRVGEDILNMAEYLFSDRFTNVNENECEPYRYCLDNYTSENIIKQINNHLVIKHLYISSKFDEKNPIIFDYHDMVQTKCGLSTPNVLGLFEMLTYQEIMIIAKKLKMDLDMLEYMYDHSDIVKEHEKIIELDIREFSKGLRNDSDSRSRFANLTKLYDRPIKYTFDNPITVSPRSIYDVYYN